jgi:DNA polymerase III alpha subunit
LTAASRRALLAARPFVDVRDLLARVALSPREVEALVLAGACDELAPLAAEAYPFAHEDLVARLRQVPPAVALEGFAPRRASGARLDAYRALVRIRNELRYLQMHPSAHPMAVLRDEATRVGCAAIAGLPTRIGDTARVAGVVAATRRLATRTGVMQFVTLEDETGLVEAVLFPATYAGLHDPITTPGPFLITGQVATDHGDLHLITSTLAPFHSRNPGVRS